MNNSAAQPSRRAIRGPMLSFREDPAAGNPAASHQHVEDGLLVIEDGRIAKLGDAAALLSDLPDGTPVDHYRGKLITPGFIDLHIHYSQSQVIASYGAQLLEWLEQYTFVEEQKFNDPVHAAAVARFFIAELLRNGTTTAAVYCTTSPHSVTAYFEESARRNTRMIAGKVLMDRNAPPGLCDTAERAYDESKALLEQWHGRGRQLYGITPRFAITSTEEQLTAAGTLAREAPDAYIQTHISENRAEVQEVKNLFPWADTYAAVYDQYGLLSERTLLGHCIHLEDSELQQLSATQSVAVLCPTSNLFIGSGLFDYERLRAPDRPVRTGLATDVGGGTSYSMLRTAAEAYKVMQLQGQRLSALEAFYMLTLGNAHALGLAGTIGALDPGNEADVIVLDPTATPAMRHRMEAADGSLEEQLFILMTLGDDRAVHATYVAGEPISPAPEA